MTQIVDQAHVVEESVSEFLLKFVAALGVVMVVSFLSLGFRAGVIVALSVPLTLAIVFLVMLATGMELERVTLGALILSLGLLVDDAIIAIEAMVVKLEEGWTPRQGGDLRLDIHRGADAVGHAGDGGGLPAGGLRAIDRGRICRAASSGWWASR